MAAPNKKSHNYMYKCMAVSKAENIRKIQVFFQMLHMRENDMVKWSSNIISYI